jgi:hypothetical protein
MFNGDIVKNFSLDELTKANLIMDKGIKLFSNLGFRIRPTDNKICPALPAKSFNVPWVYILSDEGKDCGFWHNVIFDVYELFPVGCLDCWKIVVRPRTVKELFTLHEYQDEIYRKWRNNKGFCKCGTELRKYVHGNYGGYFYNNSLEEGLECFEKVSADISKYIHPDVPVTLKRGCTEYELKYGDSSKWEDILEKGEYTDKGGNIIKVPTMDVLMEQIEIIRAHVDCRAEETPDISEGINSEQPPYVKISVMRSWLERAYEVGDSTALEFNEDGKPFYTPPVTYHNRDNFDIDKFKKFVLKEVG